MTIVNFVNTPIRENSLLQSLGITEDSEGLNVSEYDAWEWISSNGSSSIITEYMVLMTLSTDCDEWFFCRLKFQNIDGYVYLNDASLAADAITIGGIANESNIDALKIFAKIIDYEYSSMPIKITIHDPLFIDAKEIVKIYAKSQYYSDNPEDLEWAVNNCRIIID